MFGLSTKNEARKFLTLDGDGFFIGFAFSGQNKAIFKNLNHYLRSKEQMKVLRQSSPNYFQDFQSFSEGLICYK